MVFSTVSGGFEVSADDQKLVNVQRAVTHQVNQNFIQVGAVFLKASGKIPTDDKWAEAEYRQTDLQSWIDNPEFRLYNVGFNLQLGWMDIDIDAEDPEYNRCMMAALRYNQVDTRFAFGRRSVGVPTHVMVQLGEEESSNFDVLTKFEPKEFRIGGKRFHTQLRSYATNTDKKNLERTAKQTVMPGSIYLHKTKEGEYDLSVWYKDGGVVSKVIPISQTTPRRVSFNQVVRSIAYATFLYVIREHWVEGQRQATAVKVAGWLARIVKDGQAMNNHESISADVFCPVDTDDIAEDLLMFVAEYCGDEESHMRVRSYRDAVEKLDRNPDAKIPGWPALEALIGVHGVNALRTTFTPGSDVSILTKLAERYAYDETDGQYIDRDRHRNNMETFTHEPSILERRHIDETVMIGGKPRQAFRTFETSKMRVRVSSRNMYPDLEPGTIVRINSRDQVVNDDDPDDTANPVFNTWRGWPIKPAEHVNNELLARCVDYLDQLLALLTCDNAEQADWVKKWFAWTLQNPGIKQQIAWVVVGGQGVGKSFFGNTFASALLGPLWGTTSASIIDGKFNVGPFVNKMFVFVDEVKFHNESGTDEVKKLIRNVDVPGMLKYGEGQNFKIYSRLMFASNTFDMAIGQKSVIDRALFYTKAYSAKYKQMTDPQFRAYTETLKPWFEEFNEFLKSMTVREHYVRYFMDLETSKNEIESIRLSSSQDEEIVTANMRPSRRIAKQIIEECRVHYDLSIEVPFSQMVLAQRITEVCEMLHIKPVRTDLVMAEFEEAGLVRRHGREHVFNYKCETLIEMFAAATSLPMHKNFPFTDDDRGPNDDPPPRKMAYGVRTSVVQ